MAALAEPVVVGTDGSITADQAVVWAADEASLRRRPLRIVHAVAPWVGSAPVMPPAGLIVALEETGQTVLNETARLARGRRPELVITTTLAMMSAEQTLREHAETAYEIVVGHRGAGGFARMLLGSTGLHVAGRVPGPLVIVRGETDQVQGEVVVGIDPDAECGPTLDYAFEAAALRRAGLRVVHGWRPPALAGTGYAFDVVDAENAIRAEIERVMGTRPERFPHVEVSTDIVHDHPVHALATASSRADLVVVGARDRRGLGALRLGSVSHGAVHHADCPVAIIRPRDEAGSPPSE